MHSPSFETIPVVDLLASGAVLDHDDCRPIVLVVDDEPTIADTIVTILQSQGFAAYAAYDAESALEFSRVIPPRLLISDIMMPGGNGDELALDILRAVPDCRILLFSGLQSQADVLARCGEAARDFTVLAKPIHPTELLARISLLGLVNTVDYPISGLHDAF